MDVLPSKSKRAASAYWGRSETLYHRYLTLGLLLACEPFDKFCQPSWEIGFNRSIGQPQPLPKLLKVVGTERLVQCGVRWDRKRNLWDVNREQGLH